MHFCGIMVWSISVSPKIDIFALIIFLGTMQGFFLSIFFLSKNNRQYRPNKFLGLFLISVSLISLDILLSYTDFMFRVIYFVNETEPFNFLLGPLIYLYIATKLYEQNERKAWLHFLPAIFYFVYMHIFEDYSYAEKYNAHISAYHPEMESMISQGAEPQDPLFLRKFINELTILSMLFYSALSIYRLVSTRQKESPDQKRKKLYSLLWFDISIFTFILLIVIFVKINYRNDLGDYIIISAVAVFIYMLSFLIVRNSVFFQKSQYDRKYSKSALDEGMKDQILAKLQHILISEKLYRNSSVSLLYLAKRTHCTPNHLSQIINERLQKTLPELLADYRIADAQKILMDPGYASETIEGIALAVGYNSKSTFNKVFKKITGQTPSQFRLTSTKK
ncbi:MAG: AraC family transcriptional regulator [Calditrichaeota bacterium]|nr:MAG: AraC family transcriptional regulator [Calditrichota bacterium]